MQTESTGERRTLRERIGSDVGYIWLIVEAIAVIVGIAIFLATT